MTRLDRTSHGAHHHRWLRRSVAVAAAALLSSGPAAALPTLQTVSPFDVTGLLQAATVDTSGPLAGGTVTVNNQVIVVPKNLLVQLPATFLTWPELFRLAPPPYGPTQTGMALADLPTPLGAYQVRVQGNRVGDQHIAGLITISQVVAAAGQGFINYIDYARGELRVGGAVGNPTSGQRVKLNDPIGRFGQAWSPDWRFTIDESNPTVRAETAYPMCVPRVDPAAKVDPECPEFNRPRDPTTGNPLSILVMPDPAVTQVPDSTKQAPFEIGDFVTYAGILVKDGAQPTAGPMPSTGTLIAAYSLIANVAIFTWPGADPAYLAVDVAILGVGGTPIAGVPQEATVRTRFEGFSTDPSRVVVLFGVDLDPCTAMISERDWGMIAVDPGPPVGAVLGRWRFRPPSKVLAMPSAGVFLPATRTVRAAIAGVPMIVANGLAAGSYEAPIGEYLFPENLAVGNPPVPLNFQEFPFLANGSGPWTGVGPNPVDAGIVGQLSPWPGQPVPTAPTCAPYTGSGGGSGGTTTPPPTTTLLAPIANAGLPLTVGSASTVQLNGLGSTDPNSPALALTYAWSQVAGPAVTLNGAGTATPTFTAPIVAPGPSAVLAFSLTVTNSAGLSSSAQVTVTVNPVLAPVAVVGASQSVPAGATVTLNGSGSFDPNGLPLTYRWTQLSGPAVTLSSATVPSPTFKAPSGFGSTLVFALVVSNGTLSSAAAQTSVSVRPPDIVTVLTATYSNNKQRLTVTASSNAAGAQLSLKGFNGGADVPMTMVNGVASVTLTGVVNPGVVTVVSNLGGSGSLSVTAR